MSTIEKALIQIFERKNRIIDNVKQQILLFDHQLASKCLIDGFVPPPWLLSTSPSELNKEDLISGLLLPRSEHSIPYCSLYQQPVVTNDNVNLPPVLCSRVDASNENEGLDKFLYGKTDELDPSVTSPPQDCRDGMVSDICPDPCLSLARIQRSKSRQRALEHRNSAKKLCKKGESCDNNCDACNCQNKVSKIASLQSGPVDKMELIRAGDDVVSYEGEKEEKGQYRSKERSGNFYSDRITRSRSSVQPSKSHSGPSGAGNTSHVAKQDEVVPRVSICKSGEQHVVNHELLESEFVEPVDNTESFVVKNEERGQCWSQGRGEDICPGSITKSRTVHPPISASSPPSPDMSFCVAKQDDILLTESINKSGLQPDAADELLQSVKPVDNAGTCVAAKDERDQYQSKEKGGNIYSGRVTRSRNSDRSPKSVNGLSCAGKTSKVAKCDNNMLLESISRSKEQPSAVDKLLALVKPTPISDETCVSMEARDHRSKERKAICPDRNINDGICKSMKRPCHVNDLNELIKPFNITKESFEVKVKSHNQTLEKAVVDKNNDGSIRSKANSSAKLFKLDSSNTLENKVTQSKSTASNQLLCKKSSVRYKDVGHMEISGTQVDYLPCIDGSALAELNQCDAFVADTDEDSVELVEASASSASNLDGGNNPSLIKSLNRYGRVEVEATGKFSQSSSAMKVLPKQLDFDDLGECTLKEASSLMLKSENMINSLEKSSLTPLPCADNLDEVTSAHHQEKHNSSHEKQLPEEQEPFCNEEKLSETAFSKTSAGRTSNLIVFSSEKHTPDAGTGAVTSSVPESNEISDVAGSNINVDSGIDHLFEKDWGKVAVKSVMLVPEASDHNLNTDLCSGPAICSPPLPRVADATSNDAIGYSNAAAVFEETKGHSLKEKMESSPSQIQNEATTGRCIAGDVDSVLDQTHAKSSDKKVSVLSIQQGKHSSPHVEGSWPRKRRKIDDQQNNSPSFSLSLKEEDAKQLSAKSLVDEEQNEGKYNRKERDIPSTFMHNQFDVASVPSLPIDTLDHSVDRTGAVDSSSFMFGSTRKCTADENKIVLNVGAKSEFENIDHLAYGERSNKESKCQLGEDGKFSTSLISSPCRLPSDLIGADQSKPELEGFIIKTDGERICNGEEGISFENFHLPNTTIGRVSLLEQLCKSACIRTPLPQFPSTYRLHQATGLYQSVPNGLLECTDLRSSSCFGEETNRATGLYQSVPNGLLECMDLRSTLPENDDRKSHLKISSSCFGEETNRAFLGEGFSDCFPLSSSQLTGNERNPYLSPVGKFWDRITSNSDSSEKRGSLKPELPCINEEHEITEEVVDAFQEATASKTVTFSSKREPLTEIRECPNVPSSVSGAENFNVRDSLDSVNTAYSFIGTEKGTKQKVRKHNATKRRDTIKLRENCSIVSVANSTKRASESLRNRFSKPKLSEKTNQRKGGPSFSQKESKINNIVSNVTSFIPIAQQKQAASIATGKRDVKVKALEAAEAAKKLAEQKENERKMKKEALKLERARLELENLRQLELEKKRKEEERKKKEASMAAKKRQREEEERLEKERKRKRLEEARRQQRGPEEKLCSKKDENEKNSQAQAERSQTLKVPNSEALKHEKMQKAVVASEGKMSTREFGTVVSSTSDAVKTSTASEDFNAKVMSTLNRVKGSDNQNADVNIEQSYDISPYKGSDDEEEDDDDENEPNRKFVPSWASKNRVALAIVSQQNVNPEAIFPPESFCSISQVLLPRKFQQNGAN
ncbi:Nicotinate/nicotinamide mononucleotide adenyltransferase isoform 1 [Hibiscus syriacus]|uniref:Nicotinate/nicotinamide mononucleotide adenyltransferase isoform 1 n=1 Tax=Hibiscus syriacus TaxID=106335 RepID=A0A6A3CVD3_HIBSY|nr:Nicotinate/nicotinamide mononucleotide adenyltransferase isoform 1 [Hibiscus syriacus]